MKTRVKNLIKENRSFLVFIALMFVFRSAVADWNEVPTGSMKPTIVEGDRIWVNKLAYDVRIPFTPISLVTLAHPQRGDVVVFDSAASGRRLVKRVVGIPGDTVALRDNVLMVNGQVLDYSVVTETASTIDKQEDLLGVAHVIRTATRGSAMSSFAPVHIPDGYYLALGDNRDNSSDSRVIGLIPREEIVGRARHVVLSLNYDNFYIPRSDRFFHRL